MCADFCSVCAYTPGNVTLAVQIFVQLRRVNRLKSFDHKKRQTVRVHLTQRFPYGEKKNPIKIILLRLSTFWLSLESGVKKKKVSTFSKDEHWLKTRGGIRKRKKNKVEKSREEEDVFSEQQMKRKKKLKHKSVKTVEKFCWNCSLPRRQPKLSCHVSELIGPSGVKTAACVQFVKRHVNTPVQVQMNGTEEQTGFKTALLTPPKLN